jgi:hypothetical protein
MTHTTITKDFVGIRLANMWLLRNILAAGD